MHPLVTVLSVLVEPLVQLLFHDQRHCLPLLSSDRATYLRKVNVRNNNRVQGRGSFAGGVAGVACGVVAVLSAGGRAVPGHVGDANGLVLGGGRGGLASCIASNIISLSPCAKKSFPEVWTHRSSSRQRQRYPTSRRQEPISSSRQYTDAPGHLRVIGTTPERGLVGAVRRVRGCAWSPA
jgi:hypothetical protein